MKKRKGAVVFAAQLILIAVAVFLAVSDANRFFPEYLYDSVGARQEKEVQAKETRPQDKREPEEEQEQSVPDTEDTVEGPSDIKYEDNSSRDSNGTGDGVSEQKSNKVPASISPVNTPIAPGPMSEPAVATEVPEASQSPKATSEPTEKPKLVSLSAKWPDKDSVVYKKEIKTTTLAVTGTYSDGSTKSIPVKDCQLVGLESKSLGKHVVVIKYGGCNTTLYYTVVVGEEFTIAYEWAVDRNLGKCFLGEDVEDIIWVYKEFSDGSQEDIDGYTLTGLDNQKTGKQSGVITYQGQSKIITCEFCEVVCETTTNYYDKSGKLLDSSKETKKMKEDDYTKFSRPEQEVEAKGEKFTLKSSKIVVDGKERTLPYTRREREFRFVITINYEVE